MGRLFVMHLEGKVYSCKHCHTHLGLSSDIISKVRLFSPLLSSSSRCCCCCWLALFDSASTADVGAIVSWLLLSISCSPSIASTGRRTSSIRCKWPLLPGPHLALEFLFARQTLGSVRREICVEFGGKWEMHCAFFS
ncbi:Os03g0698500 [Oryza sativa Japonica Group]|uniref:Os03g0698500 protein n=1 Tax=Oryza sativa subsp. japonica TaxID=39947 RepID=A0A0P0W1R3_ORYSJ|nr:Os03g0698500 [Oryza sativa Japonica Group]